MYRYLFRPHCDGVAATNLGLTGWDCIIMNLHVGGSGIILIIKGRRTGKIAKELAQCSIDTAALSEAHLSNKYEQRLLALSFVPS